MEYLIPPQMVEKSPQVLMNHVETPLGSWRVTILEANVSGRGWVSPEIRQGLIPCTGWKTAGVMNDASDILPTDKLRRDLDYSD